jgi:hypothetical protein
MSHTQMRSPIAVFTPAALRFGLLFLMLALLLPAADVSGVWKGSFDFQGTAVPLSLNLKSAGVAVTGTIEGLPTTPLEIHDGKVDGDSFTFWVITDYNGTAYKLVYKGKITASQIAFTFGTEDGSFNADLVVKKG